jgi:hypothetical protein
MKKFLTVMLLLISLTSVISTQEDKNNQGGIESAWKEWIDAVERSGGLMRAWKYATEKQIKYLSEMGDRYIEDTDLRSVIYTTLEAAQYIRSFEESVEQDLIVFSSMRQFLDGKNGDKYLQIMKDLAQEIQTGIHQIEELDNAFWPSFTMLRDLLEEYEEEKDK